MEEELGDLLFSCTNVAEKLGLDAEQALSRSCDKFIARFEEVEQLAEKEGIRMETAELDTLNRLWKKAKEQLI